MDSRGAVIVDKSGQTSVESIAVGDVSNRLNLTPIAIREGQAFADRHFGELEVADLDYTRALPTAVFTTPEVGVVGLPEKLARAKFPARARTEDSSSGRWPVHSLGCRAESL